MGPAGGGAGDWGGGEVRRGGLPTGDQSPSELRAGPSVYPRHAWQMPPPARRASAVGEPKKRAMRARQTARSKRGLRQERRAPHRGGRAARRVSERRADAKAFYHGIPAPTDRGSDRGAMQKGTEGESGAKEQHFGAHHVVPEELPVDRGAAQHRVCQTDRRRPNAAKASATQASTAAMQRAPCQRAHSASPKSCPLSACKC